jgi:release factor glutamine methyltransferase
VDTRRCRAISVNIRDVFSLPSARSLPRSEVRLLLAHLLARDQAWLVAHDDAMLSGPTIAEIESLLSRRTHGEPIAYLIGARDFYGRSFRCSPAALIPRPETELLVEHTLVAIDNIATANARRLNILDVGTGTGCIAITLALERTHTAIVAVDVSEDALALARDNAAQLASPAIELVRSNWFSAIDDDQTFDIIVSNPPYIVPGDAHLAQGDLRFEPPIALADTVDGLESYRQLARGARTHLRDGGVLLVEHGYDQGESVPALFHDCGFTGIAMIRDWAGLPRITLCKKPPPATHNDQIR